MTDCYYVLLASIQITNKFILSMAGYALALVITYPVLGWMPADVRGTAQQIYLGVILVGFIATMLLFASGSLPVVELPTCAF